MTFYGVTLVGSAYDVQHGGEGISDVAPRDLMNLAVIMARAAHSQGVAWPWERDERDREAVEGLRESVEGRPPAVTSTQAELEEAQRWREDILAHVSDVQNLIAQLQRGVEGLKDLV